MGLQIQPPQRPVERSEVASFERLFSGDLKGSYYSFELDISLCIWLMCATYLGTPTYSKTFLLCNYVTPANFNRYVIMSHVSPTQYDIFERMAVFRLVLNLIC